MDAQIEKVIAEISSKHFLHTKSKQNGVGLGTRIDAALRELAQRVLEIAAKRLSQEVFQF